MKNKGFSAVEGILVVVVIALIGLVGWKAYEAFVQQAPASDQSSQQQSQDTVTDIRSEQDVDKASTELDQMSDDDTELEAIEKELNF